jgi:hypothetical protein
VISRLAAATVALVLTVGVATGCSSPAAAPELSPTFTSKDQAFAAAEATYRAYVDALNKVDLSDPSTFEGVYAWTTGELNGRDRKNFADWHAKGYSLFGDAQVDSVSPRDANLAEQTVVIDACYDVSGVDVRDDSGESLVSAERPDIQSLQVTFVGSATAPHGLVMSSIDPASDESC